MEKDLNFPPLSDFHRAQIPSWAAWHAHENKEIHFQPLLRHYDDEKSLRAMKTVDRRSENDLWTELHSTRYSLDFLLTMRRARNTNRVHSSASHFMCSH